jgi:hypothetical protein
MKKPPKDPNQFGKFIVDAISGDTPIRTKDPNAVALGRKGGLRGGNARRDALTPEKRKEIAKLAAKKRWEKKR